MSRSSATSSCVNFARDRALARFAPRACSRSASEIALGLSAEVRGRPRDADDLAMGATVANVSSHHHGTISRIHVPSSRWITYRFCVGSRGLRCVAKLRSLSLRDRCGVVVFER